jgi:hypothetical protein
MTKYRADQLDVEALARHLRESPPPWVGGRVDPVRVPPAVF